MRYTVAATRVKDVFQKGRCEEMNLDFDKSLWEKDLAKHWDAPYVHGMAVFLRSKMTYIRRMHVLIDSCGFDASVVKTLKKHVFLPTDSKDLSLVKVYPDVRLPDNMGDFYTIDRLTFGFVGINMGGTVKLLKAKAINPYTKSRFEGIIPSLREISKGRKVMKIGKFLTDVLGLRDDLVRDIASSLQSEYVLPPLFICETAEDYHTMYNTGPSSCMTENSPHGFKSGVLEEGVKFHPASMYHYIPLTGGAFFTKKGAVAARAVLLRKSVEDKLFTHIGRVYANNEADGNKLKRLIKETYNPDIRMDPCHVSPEGPFEVEGRRSPKGGGYAIPYPYFDNVKTSNLYIMPKEGVEGTYIVGSIDKLGGSYGSAHHNAVRFRPTSGRWMMSNTMAPKIPCTQCGQSYQASTAVGIDLPDGRQVCSSSCARDGGYMPVYNGRGVIHAWVPYTTNSYPILPPPYVYYVGQRWYTNEEALRRTSSAMLLRIILRGSTTGKNMSDFLANPLMYPYFHHYTAPMEQYNVRLEFDSKFKSDIIFDIFHDGRCSTLEPQRFPAGVAHFSIKL